MRLSRALATSSAAALLLLVGSVPGAAASAFYAGAYTAELSGQGEGTHVLTIESGLTLKCSSATLAGQVIEPAEELSGAVPGLSECTFAGFVATVTNEGCSFTLDAANSDMDVVCAAGKGIKVGAGTCEFKIVSQNGLSAVEYATVEGSPQSVLMTENVSGLKYAVTKDGFGCPLSSLGEKSGATLTGKLQLKAILEETQVELFLAAAASTKLCKALESPCTMPYGVPGPVKATVEGNATFEFLLGGEKTITCTKSTLEGTTELLPIFGGGTGRPVDVKTFTFEGCSGKCTVALTKRPYVFFLFGNGGDGDFNVAAVGAEPPTIEIGCAPDTCIFSSPAFPGAVKGAVKKTTPAKLTYAKRKMQLVKIASNLACGGPLEISATYKFEEPGAGEFWVTL